MHIKPYAHMLETSYVIYKFQRRPLGGLLQNGWQLDR